MINQIDQIVEHLFNKKRLDDVSIYELERFIATHPYFAAGHFLLAKKSQSSHPEQVNEKVATTALYYNNALWLQWLLDHDTIVYSKKEKSIADDNNGEHSHQQTVGNVVSIDGDEELIISPSEITSKVNSGSADLLSENEVIPSPENIPDSLQPIPEEEQMKTQEQEKLNEDLADTQIVDAETEKEHEFEPAEENVNAATEAEAITEIEGTPIPAQETESITDSKAYDHMLTNQHLPVVENASQPEITSIDNKPSWPPQNEAEEAETRASAASIERTLTTAALIPTKAALDKNEFTFEPYHTIDYFASQGIKLQQADLSKDKFGKQLKSFTEWLRSMKRLPQAVAEANMDESAQQSIQRIAEHSFEQKEIVTETMAEVWIKQGNKEKAIDTLHKLSLLNPSKSHYFAAKIEQLKGG